MKPFSDSSRISSNIQMLEAWIESHIAYKGLPGLSIGIVHDQELVWSRGFGFSDPDTKTPATTQTLYRIASITKVFTATAIMQLRDAGKLKLDDPIGKYLSWYKIKNRHPGSPTATIRHLLTHTSGLPRESAFPYWVDFQFPTREQIRQTLPDQETAYPVNTKWKYSNLAVTLAGEIVEAVSNEPYADYIRKHILDPLEMHSTAVFPTEEHKKRLARGYGRRLPDGSCMVMPYTDSRGLAPAANMASNVEDLARFISLQFRDEPVGARQILSGSSLREMHQIHWIQPDWKSGWGLGFGVKRLGNRIIVGHGGSLAGYRTRISFCPEEKVGAIVCINSNEGDPVFFADQVFLWVAPLLRETCAPTTPEKTPDPAWTQYVGKYRNLWWDARIMIFEGDLVLFDPTGDDPKSSLMKLVPEGENVFRMEGEDGSSSIGEKVFFEFAQDRKISRVKVGESYIYPVESWYDPMPGELPS